MPHKKELSRSLERWMGACTSIGRKCELISEGSTQTMNNYSNTSRGMTAVIVRLRSYLHEHGSAKTMARRCYSLALFAVVCGSGSVLNAASSANALAGRWDLTLTTPKGELPSWIEVSEDQGQTKLVMVGVTDHATSLQKFEIKGNEIQFVSPKGEEGFANDMNFKGKLAGQHLTGMVTDSVGDSWQWEGVRAPKLDRKSPSKWGAPVKLFDEKNLSGWHLGDANKAGSWKVENGMLVSTGHGTELISDSKFGDFKLHVEFKCGSSSNSGIFLRGRYEVQIETDSVAEPNSHHTGGVYGFLDPMPEQPRKADVWQAFDIILVGRKVTVVQNGVTIIDNREIPGITGGALDSHEGLPGPIYLQGSEEGIVTYRNMVITPAVN
jgi:hypothetical protein